MLHIARNATCKNLSQRLKDIVELNPVNEINVQMFSWRDINTRLIGSGAGTEDTFKDLGNSQNENITNVSGSPRAFVQKIHSEKSF